LTGEATLETLERVAAGLRASSAEPEPPIWWTDFARIELLKRVVVGLRALPVNLHPRRPNLGDVARWRRDCGPATAGLRVAGMERAHRVR
jgi:hypothetical protein